MQNNGLYALKGNQSTIARTKRRRRASEKKQPDIAKALRLLRFIPTIQCIGLSGSIAMENADKYDDIDFFVISSSRTVWTTRLLSILILDMFGLRRKPNGATANKICLNMFVDEDTLTLKPYDRDIFSAHEIVQMKPIFDRNNTYEKFIEANRWVEEYLGNSLESGKWKVESRKENTNKILLSTLYSLLSIPLTLLENTVKHLQLRYMKKKRTSEVIVEGYLRFHPQDARKWVLPVYQQNVKKILKRYDHASNDFSQARALNLGGVFSSVH